MSGKCWRAPPDMPRLPDVPYPRFTDALDDPDDPDGAVRMITPSPIHEPISFLAVRGAL